jgi:hypothetical protein
LQGISSCEDHSGIFGVNALNFTINFVGGTGASRAWRSARVVSGGTAAAPSFPNQESYSDKCCKCRDVPEILHAKTNPLEQPSLRSAVLRVADFQNGGNDKHQPIAPKRPCQMPALTDKSYNQTLPQGLTDTQLTSSNIQLQSIPERIYIFVRRTRQNLTCCDTDSYLTIKNIRVNFNNNSGLLSTFTPEQLYLSTITDGGIKNLTWDEFQRHNNFSLRKRHDTIRSAERSIQRPTLQPIRRLRSEQRRARHQAAFPPLAQFWLWASARQFS